MGYQVTSAYTSAAAFATMSRQGELTKVDHPMPPHQRSIRFNSKFGSGTIVLRVQAAGPQCNSARTPKNTGTVQTPKTRRRAPRGQGTVASMDIMSKRIFSADMRFRYDSFQLSLCGRENRNGDLRSLLFCKQDQRMPDTNHYSTLHHSREDLIGCL